MNARKFLNDLKDIQQKSDCFLKDPNFEKHIDFFLDIKDEVDKNIEIFQKIQQKIDSSLKNVVCNEFGVVITINDNDDSEVISVSSSSTPNSIDNSSSETFNSLVVLKNLKFVDEYEKILSEQDDQSKQNIVQELSDTIAIDKQSSSFNQNESTNQLEITYSNNPGKKLVDEYLDEKLGTLDENFVSYHSYDYKSDKFSNEQKESIQDDDYSDVLSDVSDISLDISITNKDDLNEKNDPKISNSFNSNSISNENFSTLEDFFESNQSQSSNLKDDDISDNLISADLTNSNDVNISDHLISTDSTNLDKKNQKISDNLISTGSNNLNDDKNGKISETLPSTETIDYLSEDEYDFNINFNKKRTVRNKNQSADKIEFQILEDDYEEIDSPLMSDSESVRSFRSTSSTKKKARDPLIKIKTKNFEIRLVRLNERLIELASRNAKKAAIEIAKYESKIMRTYSRKEFNFDFLKTSSSTPTNEFYDQPSTSNGRRFNFSADISDSEEECLSSSLARKKSSYKKNRVIETSSSEEEEILGSKQKNKRKAYFSSSEESTMSCDSFEDTYNISVSESNETKTKIKKKKLKVDDLYSASSDDDNSGYNSIEEVFIKTTKVIESQKLEMKKENVINVVDEDKENEIQTAPKSTTPSPKLTNFNIPKVTPIEIINHQNKPNDQPTKQSNDVRLINASKKKRTKSKRNKNEIIKILSTKDLRIETRKESRNEIERIKRILTINSRCETLNNFSELNNDPSVVLEYDKNGAAIVQIDPILANSFKKHQKEGVRFLYTNTVESIELLVKNEGKGGFGTILAHLPVIRRSF